MYNNDHRVYDLNDRTRDLSQIFQDAMDQGIITLNEADPGHSADQPWGESLRNSFLTITF